MITVRLNHTSHNLGMIISLFCFLLYIFIWHEQGTDILYAVTFLVSLTLFSAIYRVLRFKSLLDPAIWFVPIYVSAHLIIGFYLFKEIPLSWFEPYRFNFQLISKKFLIVNIVSLLAFYTGNIFIFNKKENLKRSRLKKIDSGVLDKVFFRGLSLLILAIILYYYNVLSSGKNLLELSEHYGKGQMEGRGGVNYLFTQMRKIFYLCGVALMLPVLFVQRTKALNLFLFILTTFIYLFPGIFAGDRSTIFYLVIIIGVSYVLTRNNRKSIVNWKFLSSVVISFIGLIFSSSLIRGNVKENLGEYFISFFDNFISCSGIGFYFIENMPQNLEYYYGYTYISAIFNLIPNVLFGGNRPFVSPILVFHDLFAPGNSDQGWGFSILAEAYMNGGVFSVALFFLLFSIFLTSFLLRRGLNYRQLALCSIVIIQALWFVRADSTAFLKILVYSYFIIYLATYGLTFKRKQHYPD